MSNKINKSLLPNHLGKIYLVSDCNQVNIKEYIKLAKNQLFYEILKSEIKMNNQDIKLSTSKTYYGGIRYWFECPICNKKVAIIYHHPLSGLIGCRLCLSLDYKSRRYKGMIENLKK